MAEEEVRTALIEVLGVEAARDFSPAEVGKLRMNGYKNARSLRKASREGLRFISLPEARIDDIVNARGESAGGLGQVSVLSAQVDAFLLQQLPFGVSCVRKEPKEQRKEFSIVFRCTLQGTSPR